MEVTGSLWKIIHLLLHIWEELGNIKFELPGQHLMPCLRPCFSCINNEKFRTLLAETEKIINSRSLKVETLSDVTSQIPFSPNNLLTQKTNVVLPPPDNFDRPDL